MQQLDAEQEIVFVDSCCFQLKQIPERTWGGKRQQVTVKDLAYGGADAQNVTLYGAISDRHGKVVFQRSNSYFDSEMFQAFVKMIHESS